MLRIDGLRFRDFRNYETFSIDGLHDLTVFIGPNAAGKTNVIEGIQLVLACGSLRGAHTADMLRWGCSSARIEARLLSEARDLTVGVSMGPRTRSYDLNGKRKRAGEIQGMVPIVSFSPDDLALVKGAHSYRRQALDVLGCQLSAAHRTVRRDFERLVKHKNALLKGDASPALLESVDAMLVPAGARLYRFRHALMAKLTACMQEAYADISGSQELVETSYVPSWESDAARRAAEASPVSFAYDRAQAEASMESALRARSAEEHARGRAVVGPHHDHVELFLNGRNAASFASQGQQRSLVLAWKMAEVSVVHAMAGAAPVLLLDDVMSELDAARRASLTAVLGRCPQTFVTATDLSCFDGAFLGDARICRLGE